MDRRGWLAALALCATIASGVASFWVNHTSGAVAGAPSQARVIVHPGYALEPVVDQLTAPVGAVVGPRGEVYVAESGDGTGTPPRVIKLLPGGRRTTVAQDFPAPLSGLTWHEGKLYVSYAGGVDVLDPTTGVHHPLLKGLPGLGDHPNGAVTPGADGHFYFGIGSATNAGVVGLDNILRGWVDTAPEAHDIACQPLQLRGINFTVTNPLTPDPQDMATTGAFSPFGKTTARLQEVQGAVPCTGAVLRAKPDGTDLTMVAWGLRHPAGVAFGPDGQLYATVPGYEDRGSRPVVNDLDYFYRIVDGRWYGWPDFAGSRSITEEEFQKRSMPVTPLLADHPEQPPAPIATFATRSGARGLLFPAEPFGLRGDALVALFGSTAPPGTATESHPGHMIVRVNPRNGQVIPFVRNEQPGPASITDLPGLERPIALAAGPNGSVLLVDFGQVRLTPAGPEPVPGTGALYRIVRSQAR